MPQKILKFTGINRKSNEFQNLGACEELINLRPDAGGGHHVAKMKNSIVKFTRPYQYFYEHSFGNVTNFIVVTNEGNVNWVSEELTLIKELTKFNTTNTDGITISHANHVLVIYSESSNKQVAFKFDINKNEYEEYYAAPVKMHAWIDYRSEGGKVSFASANAYVEGPSEYDSTSSAVYNNALNSALSTFCNVYKNGLCGAAIIGCTYVLEDNSEVWSSAFVLADFETPRRAYAMQTARKPLYSKENSLYKVTIYGNRTTTYCLGWDGELRGVKKINVYATRPLLRYRHVDHATEQNVTLPLDKLNIDSQLMYFQGSIDVSGDTKLILDFSTEKYGGDIMPVTTGAVERVGPNVSLNNRFHYFKSEVQHIIQTPTIAEQYDIINEFDTRATVSHWIAYVEFEGKWKLIDMIYSFSESNLQDFIYPMAGIEKMALVKGSFDSGIFEVDYTQVCYVNLKNSRAYNYSFAFDVAVEFVRDEEAEIFHDKIIEAGQIYGNEKDTKVYIRNESNTINVSMPSNPFAFSVDASYLFGGEINEIVPSYIPISSTQINQFPVTVFTNNGIYALEQGAGKVLYSGVVALQPLRSEGKALATPYGTFFASSGNLYLLSGREVTNMTYSIDGEIETNIRNSNAYKNLCMDATGMFYDFSQVLSKERLGEFIMGSRMLYDEFNNEVIISKDDREYSYVFNLNFKQFYKCDIRYLRAQSGARHILADFGDGASVMDKYNERDYNLPILLQSRPLSPATFHSHIQRIVMLCDAELVNDQYLCLSVFASDNLHDWKCIISSQKKETILRQIRANKAAKSYRDYIILITGMVDPNTDLSDIIADYTIVNRRLG